MTYLYTEKMYRCDVCGKKGPWTDDWMWYGSLKDMDSAHDKLPCVCSMGCGKVFVKQQKPE